ncbi:MAG: hypothetical protein N2512_03290 [Armatimonadetes bacterium]|nr:hypothetical protein [Armatimonadota bacterium]
MPAECSKGRTCSGLHRRWVYLTYAFLVLLVARKPGTYILHDGRVPGAKADGRIDVTTVARRLWDPTSPALAPDAHRPMASVLILALSRVPGINDLFTSYTIWRVVTLGIAVLLLDNLARRWLTPGGAFGVVVLYLLGFAHAGFDDKPDGWFEQALFAGGFVALGAGRPWWLVPIIAVGTWFRESVVFLIAAHFLVTARRHDWTRAFVSCAWLLALWALSWGAVHHIVGHVYYYSELWRLPRNLTGLASYLIAPWKINMSQYLVLGIFGALWVMPFLPRPKGPEYLERLKWLLPVALVMTLQLAKIWEVRVFYYHLMYLAPLALWKLFPDLRAPIPAQGPPGTAQACAHK